jgi:ectoine hydroxylase-related dioxygenase (phytanoyl-CoA dioxygenase family)
MAGLSDAKIKQYWDDGYLFPVDVMSGAEAANARSELEQVEADWLDADLTLPLSQYKRVNAHCVMPLAARLATLPSILDVVEGIIGPDILVWSAEFLIKEPRTSQIISMHQDLTYWGMGATDGQVTAWLALSPSNPKSGCMDFVKGTHKNEILPHNDTFDANNLLSRGQEIAVDIADEDRVAVDLKPGQMSLHHGLMIHGSGPNVSDDRRIGVVIRYISPSVKQEVASRDYAMLARGVDLSGNFIHFAEPKENFEPRALEIYDMMREDQRKSLGQGLDKKVKLYQASG